MSCLCFDWINLGACHPHPHSNQSPAVLAQAAITKYFRLGGLSNRGLFLTVLEAGKPKIKVPADSVFGESPFPGLQMAAVSLCAHMAFLWCMHVETEALIPPPLLIRPPHDGMRASPS